MASNILTQYPPATLWLRQVVPGDAILDPYFGITYADGLRYWLDLLRGFTFLVYRNCEHACLPIGLPHFTYYAR